MESPRLYVLTNGAPVVARADLGDRQPSRNRCIVWNGLIMLTSRHQRRFAMSLVLAGFSLGVQASDLFARQYDTGVRVEVYQTSEPQGVRFHYRVTNNIDSHIERIYIGWDGFGPSALLTVPPVGWSRATGFPAGTATQPAGWTVELFDEHEDPSFRLVWDAQSLEAAVEAGETVSGFSVLVPKPDNELSSGGSASCFRKADWCPATLRGWLPRRTSCACGPTSPRFLRGRARRPARTPPARAAGRESPVRLANPTQAQPGTEKGQSTLGHAQSEGEDD
jgi:hypothetical protein